MTYFTYGGIACDEVIRAVWDFLDDEIDGGKKRRIVHHLELCDHCRDQYTFEGSFLRAVGRLLERDGESLSLRDRIETELTKYGFAKVT
jgi:anti-sigma factor (TIGR02949 family)